MKKKIEEKKWADILAEISTNVTEVSYRTWFAPLFPLEIDEDAGVLSFVFNEGFICHLQLFLGVSAQSGVEEEDHDVALSDIFVISVL